MRGRWGVHRLVLIGLLVGLLLAPAAGAQVQGPVPEEIDPANGMPRTLPSGYLETSIPGDGPQDLATFLRENQLSQREIDVVQPGFLKAFRRTWINQASRRIIVALVVVMRSPEDARLAMGPMTTELPPGARYVSNPRPAPGIAECVEARIQMGETQVAAAGMSRGPTLGFVYLIQEGGPPAEDEFRALLMAQVESLDQLIRTRPALPTHTPAPAPEPGDDGIPGWIVPAGVGAIVVAGVGIVAVTRRRTPYTPEPDPEPLAGPPVFDPTALWAPSPAAGIPAHPRPPGGNGAPPPPAAPPPAWQPDPTGRHQLRYWDGSKWTEHVSDDGVVRRDLV